MFIPILGFIITWLLLGLLNHTAGKKNSFHSKSLASQKNISTIDFQFYILSLMSLSLSLIPLFGAIFSIPFIAFLVIFCFIKKRWVFAVLQLGILVFNCIPIIFILNEQYFYNTVYEGKSLFYWASDSYFPAIVIFSILTFGMISIDFLLKSHQQNKRSA